VVVVVVVFEVVLSFFPPLCPLVLVLLLTAGVAAGFLPVVSLVLESVLQKNQAARDGAASEKSKQFELFRGRSGRRAAALLALLAAFVTLLTALGLTLGLGLGFKARRSSRLFACGVFAGLGVCAAAAGLSESQTDREQHGEYNCPKLLHAISFEGKSREVQSYSIKPAVEEIVLNTAVQSCSIEPGLAGDTLGKSELLPGTTVPGYRL
jgi:hypothetical protein